MLRRVDAQLQQIGYYQALVQHPPKQRVGRGFDVIRKARGINDLTDFQEALPCACVDQNIVSVGVGTDIQHPPGMDVNAAAQAQVRQPRVDRWGNAMAVHIPEAVKTIDEPLSITEFEPAPELRHMWPQFVDDLPPTIGVVLDPTADLTHQFREGVGRGH